MSLLLLITLSVSSAASTPAKAPWALTVEERIALRTNASLARERIGSARIRSASDSASAEAARPWVDQFDGKTHPELFLPHEVFDELIKLAFLSSPRTGQVVRDGLLPQARKRGLPADFWERLRALSAVYASDFRAVKDLDAAAQQQSGARKRNTEEALRLKHDDVCRSRADALAAARRTFGRDRFDRFLYEVIAVNMFSATDRLPTAEILRDAEEGCR